MYGYFYGLDEMLTIKLKHFLCVLWSEYVRAYRLKMVSNEINIFIACAVELKPPPMKVESHLSVDVYSNKVINLLEGSNLNGPFNACVKR